MPRTLSFDLDMSKYIDSEKLKAEIERLHKAHSGKYGCDEVGLNLEYLEDFIDSLQQEQPKVDLEKEIEEHVKGMPMSEFTHESEVGDHWDWAREEFRHFFELGLNARKKENK